MPLTGLDEAKFEIVKNKFHEAHKEAFGYCLPESEIAIVNLQVTSIGKMPRPELARHNIEKGSGKQALKSVRPVFLSKEYVNINIYDRYLLKPGNAFEGPCIVEQKDTTTLVWPEQHCEVDTYGNLIIYTKSGRLKNHADS